MERNILKDEMDKKQGLLLADFAHDLDRVQQHFHAHKNNPRIDNNMPPVAGAVAWCRGLRNRLAEPMEKLKQYLAANPGASDTDQVKVRCGTLRRLCVRVVRVYVCICRARAGGPSWEKVNGSVGTNKRLLTLLFFVTSRAAPFRRSWTARTT